VLPQENRAMPQLFFFSVLTAMLFSGYVTYVGLRVVRNASKMAAVLLQVSEKS